MVMGKAESALPRIWVPVTAAPSGMPSAAAASRGNGISIPAATVARAADRNSRESLRAVADDGGGSVVIGTPMEWWTENGAARLERVVMPRLRPATARVFATD